MLKNLSLKITLIVGLILGLSLPFLFNAWYQYHAEQETLSQELDSFHEQITHTLAISLRRPLWHYNVEWGEELVQAAMQDKRIFEIKVHDAIKQQVFLHHYVLAHAPQNSSPKNARKLSKVIVYQGERIGKLSLHINTASIAQHLHEEQRHLFSTLLFQLVFGLTLLLPLLYYKVLKPVRHLLQQSQALSKQQLDTPFVWSQQDELGQLGQSFERSRQAISQLVSDLEQSNAQAEKANRLKGEFLSKMSHEIRTPMNAILGFADLLQQRSHDNVAQQYALAIHQGSTSLMRLIEDILDLSKIESGRLSLEYGPVSVRQVCQEIAHIFAPSLAQKGLHFDFDIPSDLPEILLLDEVRVRQILINLVGNAVKFTDSGYVRLAVQFQYHEPQKKSLRLRWLVLDTGIGIPHHQRERVFLPFEQRQQHTQGGTGLGLSISQRLAEIMNGEITLYANRPHGTVFQVVLHEVALPEFAAKTPQRLTQQDWQGLHFAPAKILLLDQDDACRALLKHYLANYGFSFLEASDGHAALNLIEQENPDLVLFDVKLPMLDGWALCRQLRHQTTYQHLPLIAVTAAINDDTPNALSSLLSAHLSKPLRQAELIQCLCQFLPYEHSTVEIPQPQVESKALAQTQHLPAKMVVPQRLVGLRNSLQASLPEDWQSWLQSSSINEQETLGSELRNLADTYTYPPLSEWGEQVAQAAREFDLENLEQTLQRLPQVLLALDEAIQQAGEMRD